MEHLDPAPIFEWHEKMRGPLAPPGYGCGVVVARHVGQDEVTVGLSQSHNKFLIALFDADYASPATISELTSWEYDRLLRSIDKEEYRCLGGISGADVLDGESYFVRYVDPSGKTDILLGNPRECDPQLVHEFADALDALISEAKKRCRHTREPKLATEPKPGTGRTPKPHPKS